NPKLKFSWVIGYDEHTEDVDYYDQIRHMNDPRFEWVDTRVGRPGPAALATHEARRGLGRGAQYAMSGEEGPVIASPARTEMCRRCVCPRHMARHSSRTTNDPDLKRHE
ncbi:MAG: hypothetical protein QF578_21815, partial [Alphaproteobacteria bacterium]|nr:hypothetical protein [Alphaproteobacteria bacterium]